jgi:hypothetical protein
MMEGTVYRTFRIFSTRKTMRKMIMSNPEAQVVPRVRRMNLQGKPLRISDKKTTGGSKQIVPFNGGGSSAGTHGSTYLELSAARSMERNYRKFEDGEVEEIGGKSSLPI